MASMYRKGMVGFSGGNTTSFAREGGQGSKPLGAGRGPIRTAMANDSFKYSLKDRKAARRADKAMAGATSPTPAQPMQPAPSRLNASPTPTPSAPAATQPSNQGSVWKNPPQPSSEPRTQWEMDRAQRLKKNDEMRTMGLNPTTGRPMGAEPNIPQSAPLQGRALAEKNIAEKGIQGATADYFQRRDNEMLAKQQKQIDTAFSKPVRHSKGEKGVTNTAPTKAAYRNPIRAQGSPPLSPTMGMGAPDAPASSVAANNENNEFGQGNMDWTPRDSRQDARDAVANSAAKGEIPNYQDRMQSGFVSGKEIVTPVKNKAIQIGQAAKIIGEDVASATRKGVASARNFSDRTNAWAENFRNGGKPSWKTQPPLTADIGKADVMPNKRKPGM